MEPSVRADESFAPPFVAVGALSAAAVAYEVLLTRLFSIIQWHHFASMMISVAMLGWGAAGACVTLWRKPLTSHFHRVFAMAAVTFGLCAIACFVIAESLDFIPFEALWEPKQFLRVALIYLCLFLPFFSAALGLCLAFSLFGAQAPRLYAFDIFGAGVGSFAVLGLLFALPPMRVLAVVSAVGVLAAVIVLGRRKTSGALFVSALLLACLPSSWLPLRLAEYKDLSQILKVGGARVIAETSSPLGLVSVVESRQIPFHYAPGLSLAMNAEPPEQLGAYLDANGLMVINRFDGRFAPLAYLDGLTSALPYHLLDRPEILVIGAGGGESVLQALYFGARFVDVVELNARLPELVENELASFSGRPFHQPGVHLHNADGRAFLASQARRYELIQFALPDNGGAALSGLGEGYLLTREALQSYLAHLAPSGLLAFTRWFELPPRELVKLAATAIEALEARGVKTPSSSLALIRGWRTATLLVKNGSFSAAERETIRRFCKERSFDIDWLPGLQPEETNRYNILERPYLYEALSALLGERREEFLERYKYHVTPASDDRPFFFHFFKWRSLPEWLDLRTRGGIALSEWGYPVLVATVVQALCAATLMIIAPLMFGGSSLPTSGRLPVFVCFAMLGVSFMFIEVASMHRFLLFLGHPLYAIAVAIGGFLMFAGLGSRVSGVFKWPTTLTVKVAVIGILFIIVSQHFFLPELFHLLAGWSDVARIATGLALIAPLAFLMGMPFPLCLQRLAAYAPAFLPWAWGINASASVIAAPLASLLAMHVGFSAVDDIAAFGYLLVGALFAQLGIKASGQASV